MACLSGDDLRQASTTKGLSLNGLLVVPNLDLQMGVDGEERMLYIAWHPRQVYAVGAVAVEEGEAGSMKVILWYRMGVLIFVATLCHVSDTQRPNFLIVDSK